MRTKTLRLSNFSHTQSSKSSCLRPDNEKELLSYLIQNKPAKLLARGSGLSYSDSCLNQHGLNINTKRFNHLISFDEHSGLAVCQAGTLIKDLFLLHPEFIPPVIPGTIHATVAGCIAHDVHGKNNHQSGSFGHHIQWIELLIDCCLVRCSSEENQELFYATMGGLGLTGIITRIAIQLKKTSRCVQTQNKKMNCLNELLENMSSSLHYEYQVAWIDLLRPKTRGILSLANHCEPIPYSEKQPRIVPRLPMSLINKWNMKLFNSFYFHSKKLNEQLSLKQFNNPLDVLMHWNRLYGPKGLIQFQALFDREHALDILNQLIVIIKKHQAVPTLAVIKLFTQSGKGLLSFCQPGFTIAIDFNNNHHARSAIKAMNQFVAETNGLIYLAKDLLLTAEQFQKMYQKHSNFSQILASYNSNMQSDLALRLGIIQ
jgi:FAD/FMN-containing dehydrogenase